MLNRVCHIFVATTAAEAVAVAQQLNQLRARDKANLLILGRIAGSANQEIPIANINKLVESTSLTHVTISKVLHTLEVQLGIVKELTSPKRNRVYAYTEYIDILNRKLSAGPCRLLQLPKFIMRPYTKKYRHRSRL